MHAVKIRIKNWEMRGKNSDKVHKVRKSIKSIKSKGQKVHKVRKL